MTVYLPPKDFTHPEPDYKAGWAEYQKQEDAYIDALVDYVKARKKGKYAGRILRIPHADGYAIYVVASLKPATLIHVPIGDAWNSPHAHFMKGDEIKMYLDRDEGLSTIFRRRP